MTDTWRRYFRGVSSSISNSRAHYTCTHQDRAQVPCEESGFWSQPDQAASFHWEVLHNLELPLLRVILFPWSHFHWIRNNTLKRAKPQWPLNHPQQWLITYEPLQRRCLSIDDEGWWSRIPNPPVSWRQRILLIFALSVEYAQSALGCTIWCISWLNPLKLQWTKQQKMNSRGQDYTSEGLPVRHKVLGPDPNSFCLLLVFK